MFFQSAPKELKKKAKIKKKKERDNVFKMIETKFSK